MQKQWDIIKINITIVLNILIIFLMDFIMILSEISLFVSVSINFRVFDLESVEVSKRVCKQLQVLKNC